MSQGSIIWVSHGTTLYRCAPEQLRKVTRQLQDLSNQLKPSSVYQDIKNAGNKTNYRDISQDLEDEPMDSEIHEDEPPQQQQSAQASPGARLIRANYKQAARYGIFPRPADSEAAAEGQPPGTGGTGQACLPGGEPLQESPAEGAGGRDDHQGSLSRPNCESGLHRAPGVRDLADPTQESRTQLHQSRRVYQEDGGEVRGLSSGISQSDASNQEDGDHATFWKIADNRRDRERLGRDDASHHEGVHKQRNSGDVQVHDGSIQRTEAATGRHATVQQSAAGASSSELGRDSADPDKPREPRTPAQPDRVPSGAQVSLSGRRNRSRSPHPVSLQSRDGVEIHFSEHVDENDGDDDVDDTVGNCQLPRDWNPKRTQELDCVEDLNLGCFSRVQHAMNSQLEASEKLPKPVNEKLPKPRPSCKDTSEMPVSYALFQQCCDEQMSCCEIVLTVTGRDVHQVNRNGTKEWKLNEKPKRRAEVQYRHLSDGDKLDFLRAMQAEVGSYLEHEAVSIASRHGVPQERILGMRWVLTWKSDINKEGQKIGQRPKARLIIKGFQDPDILNLRKDSPTLNTQSRNTILSLASMWHWEVETGDIKTAFLNGDHTEYQREIYAEPPDEVKEMLGMRPHELFRVLKAIYGLLHAPRVWFQKLDSVLCSQGWIRCRLEPCVWKLYQNSQLCGLIGGHVDDLLVCGSAHDEYFRSKIHELKQSFPFGAWKSAMKESITFCGSELKQNKDFSIELNQEKYADSISEINFTRERKQNKDAPLTEVERKQFRVIFGGTCMEVDSNCSLALCEHVVSTGLLPNCHCGRCPGTQQTG